MESRKRKSALENYIDGLTDPPEKQRKVNEFYSNLRLFYKKRWNAPLRLPHVQGVEVNLHRLYDTVMALGGWQKIAAKERWSDIAEMFGCQDDIVCGDHAIKLIYMRYLSKYEKVQTVGDVDDYDGEMSRRRGGGAGSFFATNECPISMSRMTEYIRRDERGNIVTDPDYSKLTKSLLSGLPNETDFAMNICMLLSHAGPRQLRVSHAPTLLTILVAHAGVYDDDEGSLSDLGEMWRQATKHDFKSFWADSGVPSDMLNKFMKNHFSLKQSNDLDDDLFTGMSSEYSVKDPVSWRLNQIVTVIRNLSFEAFNRVTIVNTWPVMKFLILCASCKWAPLYTAALDALSNLASDIDLTDKTLVHISHHAILRIIRDCVFSKDKFKLIRSLEILTGLCSLEGNETTICEWLSADVVNHIFDVVGIKDIMMCVYTLECLYQVSEMGDTACETLSNCPRAIQQLVSMATLEAVSFGPAGLAGMKVVEYQPQHGPQQHQQVQQQQHPQVMQHQHAPQQVMHHGQHTPQQHHQQIIRQMPPQQPIPSSQMTVRQVIQAGQLQQHAAFAAQQQAQQNQHTASAIPPHMQQHMPSPMPNRQQPHGPLGAQIAVQPIQPNPAGGESQVEQLTEKWIRTNCVFEPGMATPRGELYAAYVDDLRNQYHSLSGSLAMFSGVMKNMYPDVAFRMAENGIMIVAQGIRLLRPHRLAPAASAQAIMPPGANAPAAAVKEDSTSSHPLMKQMLLKKDPVVTNNMSNGHNGVLGPKSEEIHDSSKTVKPESNEKVNGHSEMNGKLEVCQEPVTAASLFENGTAEEENEVRIERREQLTKTPTEDGEEEEEEEEDEDVSNDAIDAKSMKSEMIEHHDEKPMTNGKVNGKASTPAMMARNSSLKVSPDGGRKKPSTASRAAAIVAAAKAEKEKANATDEPQNIVENGAVLNGDDVTSQPSGSAETPAPVPEKAVPKWVVQKSTTPTDYMCEYDNCSSFFSAGPHVLKHVSEVHVYDEGRQLCRWAGCSDPTPRNRWSLVTHIQDSHCSENSMKMAAQARSNGAPSRRTIPRSEIVPRDVSNHPGYAKNAAIDAIRRNAFNFLAREVPDEPEGPVTKSIRLTSCLILRNLARYSSEGRQQLRRHESHLCWLALSRLESSQALAQLLSELHQPSMLEDGKTMSSQSLSAVASTASLSSMAGNVHGQGTSQQDSSAPQSANVSPVKQTTSTSSIGFSSALSAGGKSAANLSQAMPPPQVMAPPTLPCTPTRHPTIHNSIVTTPVRAGGAGR